MAATVDVDELTRRLYSSAPEDFVKVRGDGVRQLKAAGQTRSRRGLRQAGQAVGVGVGRQPAGAAAQPT